MIAAPASPPSGPCPTDVSIRDFGRAKTTALLHDVVEAVQAAAKSPKPEPVHKMRVSIRRLQQALRLFRQFLRDKGVRAVRRELRTVMDAAGELRNLDIACSLIRRSGGDAAPIRERRLAARESLQTAVATLAQADTAGRWLEQLGISDGQEQEEQTLEA